MRYKQNLRVEGERVYSYNTHVATIRGRELVRLGWWSVTTSKHINHVASEYGLTVVDKKESEPEPGQEPGPDASALKTAGMVAGLSAIFCDTPKQKNDWKKRMLSTVPGISFPDDFDTLPEEERARRLEGAEQIANNK